jgi:hypothetical protein
MNRITLTLPADDRADDRTRERTRAIDAIRALEAYDAEESARFFVALRAADTLQLGATYYRALAGLVDRAYRAEVAR